MCQQLSWDQLVVFLRRIILLSAELEVKVFIEILYVPLLSWSPSIQQFNFHSSHRVNRNVSMELKGSLSSERGHLSDVGSTLENSVTPMSQKSPIHEHLVANQMTPSSG